MNWDQWRAILWLRWRLTRNQWSRQGAFNEAIGILLGALVLVGIAVSCLSGFFIGLSALATATPGVLLFIWDGVVLLFLVFWGSGLLAEIQRSESLDLMRFMHLPVSLRDVFVFNYLASWITPSILIALPGFLCLVFGLALSRGPSQLLVIPVILGFFALVTSWTYLLRGWLVSLMANARRRRSIILAATVLLIAVSQLPNLYFQTSGFRSTYQNPGQRPALPAWFHTVQYYFPPFWIAQSSRTLAGGATATAPLAAGGLFALSALGLVLAYRGTLRFYHGAGKIPAASTAPAAPPARPDRFLEGKIPGVPDEAAAVAFATLRSYARAPEVKMVLFGQVMMNVVLGFVFLRPGGILSTLKVQPLLGAMIVAFSLFGSSQLLGNQFGFDRDSFRAFVLAPLSRRNILLGKNLGAFPFITVLGFLILTIAHAAGLLNLATFLAAVLAFVSGFLLFSIIGNLLSILTPFRIAQGSLKPTKVPPMAVLTTLLGLFLTGVVASLIFLPFGAEMLCQAMKWPMPVPVNLIGSVLILAASAAVYAATLGAVGNLLQKREQNILLAVTRELE